MKGPSVVIPERSLRENGPCRRRGALRGWALGVVLLSLAACPEARLDGAEADPASAGGATDYEIRPFDKVYLKVSRTLPIVGIIEGGWDPEVPRDIVIRTETGTTTRITADKIAEVIPRQTAEDVYRKKLRATESVSDRVRRASLEVGLGIWCKTPMAVLGGAMPRESKALEHLLNAVELAPDLDAAYAHLIGLLDALGPLEEADEEQVGTEMRVRLCAERGGHEDPELDYRMGVLLATKLGFPERARPLLEKVVLSDHDNLGQMRRSRELLRDIYIDARSPEKAVAMYEKALREPEESPENFEPLHELARLHVRAGTSEGTRLARGLFSKAQAIQPDFVDISGELAALDYREGDLVSAEKRLKEVLAAQPTNVEAAVDLVLVWRGQGRRVAAEKALKQLAPGAEGAVAARLHLVLGTVLEDRADLDGAVAEYRKALEIAPGLSEAEAALAFTLVRQGYTEEARQLADGLLGRGGEDRGTFALCSRVRAEADLSDGRMESAMEHLERAAEVDRSLLGRLGILHLRLGKLDTGYEFIQRAHQELGEKPETLNALAYYHYERGEMDEARDILDEVVRMVPPPERRADGTTPPAPRALSYALNASDLVDDMERLEVWAADFRGEDAATIPGWTETERFGPEVSRRGEALVIEGAQREAGEGETRVALDRRFDASTFERLSAVARVDEGSVRLGLLLEVQPIRRSTTTTSSAGVLLQRDPDGLLRARVRTTRGSWQSIEPTEETSASRGRTVYSGKVRWPDDGAFHTLEIRRARYASTSRTRRIAMFDLYFDGEPVAENVRVSGAGSGKYSFGLTGWSDKPGNRFSVTVSGFRMYRERSEKR